MLTASYRKYTLRFREPATTSRSVMTTKTTYVLTLADSTRPGLVGVGECALFEGLSAEDTPHYEEILRSFCENPAGGLPQLSSIVFGYEGALADLAVNCGAMPDPPCRMLTNGLIWMGDKRSMADRIARKLDAGFSCLKLKIGGIDFDDEVDLLAEIRRRFAPDRLEIRLDANGSMTPSNALDRLNRLSRFGIHSIEQPVRAGQPDAMADICAASPIPVALDEELIGMWPDTEARRDMLAYIAPAYIILKPSLCGGFESADRWIRIAGDLGIGWWATSALESNIGLTAIVRWLRKYSTTMPQGLGTGMLYENNFPSRLRMEGEYLCYGL